MHLAGSDLFGVGRRQILATAPLDAVYRRVNALVPLIDAVDVEILAVAGPLRVAVPGDPGFGACNEGYKLIGPRRW